MAKQIYNFEVFTNKKEQLRKIQKQRMRATWAKRIFLAVILILAAAVFYAFQNSRCEYYTYKEESQTESNNDAEYTLFADGYIKYSGNGVEYQKKFGTSEWNVPLSYQNPFLEQSDTYLLLADKGKNKLTIFDVNGKVEELTFKYPVVQAGISNQGIIEVILEGETSSFIQVYDKEGNIIADMKSSVDETGYPVSAAISPDGTQLSVSYFSIKGMTSKTTVAFYDFRKQLQTGEVSLKGGFDYDDLMIPRLCFVKKNVLAAFGENKTFFYSSEEEPEQIKEIVFDKNIESIFFGEKHIGYILDNSDNTDEKRYRICLYNKSGEKQLDTDVDMNYDTIRMIGKEIFAVRDNECTILNTKGRVLFQEKLDGSSIETIMPASGFRTYHVIFRDKVVKMSLRFWE